MQKKLAILLAFFIVFAPVYSNAVLPALAASVASTGGRVLVANTIKRLLHLRLLMLERLLLVFVLSILNYAVVAWVR